MSARAALPRASGHYPDAKNYCPGPAYVAALIGLAGGNQRAVARALGTHYRTVKRWLDGEGGNYPVQYALEGLAIEQLTLTGLTPDAAAAAVATLRAEHLAQLQPKD